MNSKTIYEEAVMAHDFKRLKVNSRAFADGEMIPDEYTCDGININPPLAIKGIPDETKCLAIIVDDPDAPGGTWVHWVAWNIPVTRHIKENSRMPVEGRNDFGGHKYSGPCPPSGVHRYLFKVYALDALMDTKADTTKAELEKEMSEHIIAFGELMGIYKRK